MKNYDKWNLIKKDLNNNDDVRPYYFEERFGIVISERILALKKMEKGIVI